MGDTWRIKDTSNYFQQIQELQRYTGLAVSIGVGGTVWFKSGDKWGESSASPEDMEWILRVQADQSDSDIAGLWRHLTGGDEWHRKNFGKAMSSFRGERTTAGAITQAAESFVEGASINTYRASDAARNQPEHEFSKGIGTVTTYAEASLATSGLLSGI